MGVGERLWEDEAMRTTVLAGLALLAVGCGGKAVIDPVDGAGGAGAAGPGGPGGTNVTTSTGGPVTTTTGPPPAEFDGIAEERGGGWRLRVVSFPMTCATADVDPPFGDCGWYDIDITLFVDELFAGLVATPESGIGTATVSAADPGPDCGGLGGGGGLFGDVTIVDVDDDAVVVALGPGWEFFGDPDLSPVGESVLALCP